MGVLRIYKAKVFVLCFCHNFVRVAVCYIFYVSCSRTLILFFWVSEFPKYVLADPSKVGLEHTYSLFLHNIN